MENINGIPIIHMAEVIQPVLVRYGRTANDTEVRTDILSDLRRAISSSDLQSLRRFLSQEESFWIGNLQWAYFQRFEGTARLQRAFSRRKPRQRSLTTQPSRTRASDRGIDRNCSCAPMVGNDINKPETPYQRGFPAITPSKKARIALRSGPFITAGPIFRAVKLRHPRGGWLP